MTQPNSDRKGIDRIDLWASVFVLVLFIAAGAIANGFWLHARLAGEFKLDLANVSKEMANMQGQLIGLQGQMTNLNLSVMSQAEIVKRALETTDQNTKLYKEAVENLKTTLNNWQTTQKTLFAEHKKEIADIVDKQGVSIKKLMADFETTKKAVSDLEVASGKNWISVSNELKGNHASVQQRIEQTKGVLRATVNELLRVNGNVFAKPKWKDVLADIERL